MSPDAVMRITALVPRGVAMITGVTETTHADIDPDRASPTTLEK